MITVKATEPPAGTGDAPQGWRALVRSSEIGIVVLACLVGVLAGLVVLAMSFTTQLLHEIIFGLARGQHLSITTTIPAWRAIAGPVLGGLAIGFASWLFFRRRKQPIDPIEANALHGGRMSFRDSVFVALQTMGSSGAGASVGLEAGYTQAASGLASHIGRRLRLRRADMRLMVGCAAGGAIGAAFDAPLTGAFYAFELILGSYSIAAFVPVMAATFMATVTHSLLAPSLLAVEVPSIGTITMANLPLVVLLGAACGLVGIVVMRAAAFVEAGFRRSQIPTWLRPAFGGLVVGALAVWNPSVFSAGHGAINLYLSMEASLLLFALVLIAKALASSVSIGSGFRGGLFFASLLLGVLTGRLFIGVLTLVFPNLAGHETLFALVGMSSLAVSIVGGPMTMTLLALEMTGDLKLTLAVVGAAGAASLVTRRLFGFSFATWRFHLRGESIRGAHDVGWMRDLTAGSMMRLEVPKIAADASIAEARLKYPPGSTSYLVAIGPGDAYAGMVPPGALYEPDPALDEEAAAEPAPRTVRHLLRNPNRMLLADMSVRDTLKLFEEAESEALPVVADRETRRIVGILSEAHAIKRYSDEVSRRNRELTGE
ncbi:chloride channel protein [Bosea beijingensis]|uniref:chloride channel protein n=1 Tax=Bosea beijingensis TaxID=3068632 RepID=UPI00274116C3|nr:chloride channel protein [Bosea sp. REN20]